MAGMLRRLGLVLAAHTFFVIGSTAVLVVTTISAEQPNQNPLSVAIISIFVLIPWILAIIIPLTLPSAISSFLIYMIGGFFREKLALVTAIAVGTIVTFIALSGSYPADMKFPLSTTTKVVLTSIYLACWIAVHKVQLKNSPNRVHDSVDATQVP